MLLQGGGGGQVCSLQCVDVECMSHATVRGVGGGGGGGRCAPFSVLV